VPLDRWWVAAAVIAAALIGAMAIERLETSRHQRGAEG
jgi:hypothetical protein